MLNRRRDDQLRSNELLFLAFLAVIILLCVVGRMDREDEQTMTDYMCAMIEDGAWPEDVDRDGECRE